MSLIERFRKWYEYERDCNAKTLKMLNSVPMERRSEPNFARAVMKMAHLIVARHNWLCRLTGNGEPMRDRFPNWPLEDLAPKLAILEQQWVNYLVTLNDSDLEREFSWTFPGYNKKHRWKIVDLFTQVTGHAWYHRGQIATLVKDLGGEPVETDYIDWEPGMIIEDISA